MEKRELGKRIKKLRQQRGLTLKALEADAGISATHISEIERGKTSPTVGALVQIAAALGTSPAFFLEEEELSEWSVVRTVDRVGANLPDGAGRMERLTTSIAGGNLQVCRITLAPGRTHRGQEHAHDGQEAALVVDGAVRFQVGGQIHELRPGDSIHFSARLAHAYANSSPERDASMIWVSTRRDTT